MEQIYVTLTTTPEGLGELVRLIKDKIDQLKLIHSALVSIPNSKHYSTRITALQAIQVQLEKVHKSREVSNG